jgi:hypothetical protein
MSPRVPSAEALRPGVSVPRWMLPLPIAVPLLTVFFQRSFPDPALIGFMTAVVPLVAALVLGPVWIAALAVPAIGLMAAPSVRFTDPDAGDMIAIVFVWVTAIGIAWMRRRFQSRLVTVESVAEAAQYAVLPALPERVGDLACAGLYNSATRGARVGGDLFDLRPSPFGTRMILGDVQGHGLPAVSTAATLMACFHEAILDEPDLEHIAARLERRLLVDIDEGHIPELFASALLVEFDENDDTIRLLTCGHPTPLLLKNGQVEEIPLKPRPLLGLEFESRAAESVMTTSLARGETLLAYSDGLSEARDAEGNYYHPAERLDGHADATSPERLIDFMWDDLTDFAAHLDDDVSVLAVTRIDPEEAPRRGW